MSGTDVVVIGAVNVDLVVTAPRLPGPGETVVGPEVRRHGGGKGANAAVAAARAGGRVHYIGAVGDDELGTAAVRELRADRVDVSGVHVSRTAPTGAALIVVSAEGENQIAVGAGANNMLSAATVTENLRRLLPEVGCVLVSTEIPGAAVVAAVRTATAAGVRCILNPAPVIPELTGLLELGPLLTPNAGELRDLATAAGVDGCPRTGPGGPDLGPATGRPSFGTVIGHAWSLVDLTGADVVVTLGGEGVLAVGPDGQFHHHEPHRVDVRDTTGAGDTFNGVLALGLARGKPLAQAVRAANAAAALSVRGEGARAGMPTAGELHRFLAPR